ncbi:hypothetical protein ACFL2V_16225 [Pseudomonadota bacterium]
MENQIEEQGGQVEAPETGVVEDASLGPRRLTFLSLVLKTFAGFIGGLIGTGVLVVIFLVASSILQPVLGGIAEVEAAQGEVSPLFMVILMAMVFLTALVSSMLSTLFLCFTERDRYTKIATTLTQVFVVNFVIFLFVLPIYLTTSASSLELTAYAAVLQVILSATASALILELIHDTKYPLIAVYTTLLAVLVSIGVNFIILIIVGNATIVMFVALPIIWGAIGFSQAALTMLYYWVYTTWGMDFLASTTSFGADYGVSEEVFEEEEEQEPQKEDTEGGNFFEGDDQ